MLFYVNCIAQSIIRAQRRCYASQLVKQCRPTVSVRDLRKDDHVSPYEFPSNPDALLVEPSKLTFGERCYQRFSVAFPVAAIIALMSFPLGMVTYFTLLDRNRETTEHLSTVSTPFYTGSLPPLLNARSLGQLIYVKKPTLVFYFHSPKDTQQRNQLNLMLLLLSEVSKLKGTPIDIYRVNVNEELCYLNPLLKAEISNSGDYLIHLVIPGNPESSVVPISPPVSVASFLSQVSKMLYGFNITLTKDHKGVTEIEQILSSIKRCLFVLKLEEKSDFIEGTTLRQLDARCRSILDSAKTDEPTDA